MMNLNRFMMGVALSVIALSGCSNEEQLTLSGTSEAGTPLSISVTNAGLTKVGGVVSGNQFGDGASLGLFLTKEDGSSPYDEPYNNIQYTSSNSGQTWTATSPILLTGTKATVYAYYPYDVANTNITAIPIDVTENQDVMWATTSSLVYNANPTATLQMNHALSVIRLSLTKGDYSGAGNITSITIKGDCMAKTGTLNAKDGTVTPTDGGTEIDLRTTATLSSTPTNVEQLVIPTNASGNISVTIQMDGKTFEATSSASITPEKSKAYKFGLAFSDSKLTMSTVTIGDVTEVTVEDMKPIVNSVSTITWAEAKATDGVYGIYEGKPVLYSEAKTTSETLSGVAIVMYGRALQISNSLLSSQVWGDHTVNISGITDVTVPGGGVTGYGGYLPKPGGSYSNTPHIEQTYDQWLSSGGALADTAGWSHTEALIKAQGSNYLGGATTTFRNGSSNQEYSDWFVPACGQLAYIYQNYKEINTLLPKCGGTTLPTTSSDWHLSSSEHDAYYVWGVNFSNGSVWGINKNGSSNYVRWCRYITE